MGVWFFLILIADVMVAVDYRPRIRGSNDSLVMWDKSNVREACCYK
jgi:hypothetical protein